MITITSREFNQDTSAAKRIARIEPVFIRDRGKVAHVLLSMESYEKLTVKTSLAELLACPEAADIEFEPQTMQKTLLKPAQF